jgi:hypothetical protein
MKRFATTMEPDSVEWFPLLNLPQEIIFQVLTHLDLYGLQGLLRCLISLHRIPISLCPTRHYEPEALLHMHQWQTWLAMVAPTTYEECGRKHLQEISHSAHRRSVIKDGKFVVLQADEVRDSVRMLVCMSAYPLLYFIITPICARCHRVLGTRWHFKDSGNPVVLCNDCEIRMLCSRNSNNVDLLKYCDGYAWIESSQCATLFALPSQIEVHGFVSQHGIRGEWIADKAFAYFLLDVQRVMASVINIT